MINQKHQNRGEAPRTSQIVYVFAAFLVPPLTIGSSNSAVQKNVDLCTERITSNDMQDVFYGNTTPEQRKMYVAVLNSDRDKLQNSLLESADPNFRGRHYEWLISDAVQSWNPEIVDQLLRAGADPNRRDCQKLPALAYLEIMGERPSPLDDDQLVRIAESLLASGAVVAGKTNEQWRTQLLARAADRGHINLINWLLDHGVDVNAAFDSSTALMHAISANRLVATKILLDRGADANISSKPLPTPLLVAIDCGNPELVRLLLAHGANANEGRSYATPLSEARGKLRLTEHANSENRDYHEIVKLLKVSGAK